jgi:hypothetical protein
MITIQTYFFFKPDKIPHVFLFAMSKKKEGPVSKKSPRVHKSRKKRSWVWDHFTEDKPTGSVKCIFKDSTGKVCNGSFSNIKDSTTTPLKRHLEKVHELSPPSKKKRPMSDTTEEIIEEDSSDMEPVLTQEEQETFDSLLYVYYLHESKF